MIFNLSGPLQCMFLVQNCSNRGYKLNNYIFGHRKICQTRPDIITFENLYKKIFASSSLVDQAGLAGSLSNQPGFRQTTSDLQRKLTTCTSITIKVILKIFSFYFKYWPSYDFLKFPVRCEAMQCKLVFNEFQMPISRDLHEREG